MTSQKKREKQKLKLAKKAAKLETKAKKSDQPQIKPISGQPKPPSHAVRYAEIVRGCLYVITGVSLFVALLLGQRGAIVSLDDIIDSLFAAAAGKVVLSLIGLALFLGLDHQNTERVAEALDRNPKEG